MLSKSLIAKKYSSALFEVALEAKALDVVVQNLNQVLQVVELDQQYKSFIMSRVVPTKTKFVFLNTAIDKLKLEKVTIGLLYTMVRNNRMYALQEIKKAYEARVMEHYNQLLVQVEVAADLTKIASQKIEKALAEALNKKIELEITVKPELLGGIIVKYESKMLDRSLASKLNRLVKLALN